MTLSAVSRAHTC